MAVSQARGASFPIVGSSGTLPAHSNSHAMKRLVFGLAALCGTLLLALVWLGQH
ncbi:hypothetical protein [Bradyrhizobium sp. DASA03120]|uniref:hypothetical protein n=1 Tax=Bradyrhizobium sp. SMVTL-02 TaxID=3395917 RepID=UPI003F7282BA